MTLPRSSGCTRTSRTCPRRSPRPATRTSSGCSTMPLTRCSRASSSTSASAGGLSGLGSRRLGRWLRGGRRRRIGPRPRRIGLSRRCLGLSRRCLRLSRRHLGHSSRRLGLGRRSLRRRSLRRRGLGRRLGLVLLAGPLLVLVGGLGRLGGGLPLGGPVGLVLLGLSIDLLGPALRRGLAGILLIARRLGEALSLARLRNGHAQRSLRARLAAELLPVAGDLEDATYRIGRLSAD